MACVRQAVMAARIRAFSLHLRMERTEPRTSGKKRGNNRTFASQAWEYAQRVTSLATRVMRLELAAADLPTMYPHRAIGSEHPPAATSFHEASSLGLHAVISFAHTN